MILVPFPPLCQNRRPRGHQSDYYRNPPVDGQLKGLFQTLEGLLGVDLGVRKAPGRDAATQKLAEGLPSLLDVKDQEPVGGDAGNHVLVVLGVLFGQPALGLVPPAMGQGSLREAQVGRPHESADALEVTKDGNPLEKGGKGD